MVGRVGRLRRRQVMLEEHVVLVRGATDTAEDVAFHKVVAVRSEAVDNLEMHHHWLNGVCVEMNMET
jgi:hypothetical protein